MRRSKITPEIRARCAEIAALKRMTPSYKELELETGIHRNYLAKVIHSLVHSSSPVPTIYPAEENILPKTQR